MAGRGKLVHSIILLSLPVLVAALDWSVLAAVAAVLSMLAWRWLLSLSTFVLPEREPALVLESIRASHFVEKVRWNMDAAGLEYIEKPSAGALGACFLGRTVPRLEFQSGAVRSQIGNSAQILRYLWGAHRGPLGERVDHLEPTPERIELEKRLDRHGVSLQVWVYYHLLADRELTLHAWGINSPAVPLWQRWLLKGLFPLLAMMIRKSFRITPGNYEKACERIETLLADIDGKLADGRASILGGDTLNYTDYAFAAMAGLWLQPAAYGGGQAEDVRIERDRAPEAMRADIERWSANIPHATRWVERLYAQHRLAGPLTLPGKGGAADLSMKPGASAGVEYSGPAEVREA